MQEIAVESPDYRNWLLNTDRGLGEIVARALQRSKNCNAPTDVRLVRAVGPLQNATA